MNVYSINDQEILKKSSEFCRVNDDVWTLRDLVNCLNSGRIKTMTKIYRNQDTVNFTLEIPEQCLNSTGNRRV
jgi:hypothetical protein